MKTNFYILWDDHHHAWIQSTEGKNFQPVKLKTDATPFSADEARALMELWPHVLAEYVFTRNH
jgi:hypothetical protein